MKNYYSILGLEENASSEDIRKAYKQLAKVHHPDVSKQKNAHEKFIEISEAYEFLISQTQKEAVVEEPDFSNEELLEKLRQEARARAQRYAQMRYAEFQKQHEAFQKSGLNDIGLFFLILLRILLIPISLILVFLPLFLAIFMDWRAIFIMLLLGPFAVVVIWYMRDHRMNYFLPGKFYYTPRRIWELYQTKIPSEQHCYYAPYEMANAKPYEIQLLKLKALKLKSDGIRQHYANYVNDKFNFSVPRSKKAFQIHAVNVLIKVLSIVFCLIFLDISSFVWRFIIGIFAGGFLSACVLLISDTKSNVSYVFNINFVIRIFCWLAVIAIFSEFSLHPFDVRTSDYIQLIVACILFLDCFLMQMINLLFGTKAELRVFKQHPAVEAKFNEGYRVYNDVMIVSVVYPLFKWIAG